MQTYWVIVGCGYTGTRLARRLLQAKNVVIATRRSSAGVDETRRQLPDADVRCASLQDPDSLRDLVPRGATVVMLAPPSGDDFAERVLVAACLAARRLVYVSSTGVYADGEGAWVDENFPRCPVGEPGRHRLRAEQVLQEGCDASHLEFAVLRAAGIYGPGRGVHSRMLRGDYRILGDGQRFVSRIHVDDLVSSVIAAAFADPLPHRFFNVADNMPTTSRAMADGVAALLGIGAPASMPESEASPAARAMLTANRKINNRRLREALGVELLYPSWREGVPQALEEEARTRAHSSD